MLSTARAATDERFVVSVVREGCADPKAGVHDVLVESVLSMTAHVVGVQEVIGLWEKREEV